MSAINKLFDFIPEKYFIGAGQNGGRNLRENKIGHIKLAFVRETTNPMIIRSTDSEATITILADGDRELVEIPPRKIKSREKLLGLMICREFQAVHEDVRYNSIFKSEQLANPNSITFGDSVTQSGDPAALASRAIYDWAYSLRDVKDITGKLQHNAMSEDGTIIKKKDVDPKGDDSVAPQALHQTEYVLPGTYFPHFITVDNISPELFLHLLFAILNQHRYGAQVTTNAANLNNHLVAVGFGPFEKPITSFTVSKAWQKEKGDEKPTLVSVSDFVRAQMTHYYGANNLSRDAVGLVNWINELWVGTDRSHLQAMYDRAGKDCLAYLESLKMIKREDGKTKRGKKDKDDSAEAGQTNGLFDGGESDENPASDH